MARLIKIGTTLLALFFVFGAFAAWNNWLDVNKYILITGLIGSFASIIPLVSLGMPRLTAKDIRDDEADLFNRLSETADSVKKYEEQLQAGKEEMDRIAQQRAELELLVRRAALKAFSEERLRYISMEVSKRIESDAALTMLLDEYVAARDRATEISNEIERSDRADLIDEIISEFRRARPESYRQNFYIHIAGNRVDIMPIFSAISRAAEIYVGSISRLLKR